MFKKIYIEAGANNGMEQSRSLHLASDPDYFGILIEPDIQEFGRLIANRNNGRTQFINAALVDFGYEGNMIKLFKHNASLMNSVVPRGDERYDYHVEVEAKTLADILIGIREVEYLFLDVEGWEHQVLRGVDFDRVRFNNIEVESHYPFLGVSFEEDKENFVGFLSQFGYKLTSILQGDGLPKLTFQWKQEPLV